MWAEGCSTGRQEGAGGVHEIVHTVHEIVHTGGGLLEWQQFALLSSGANKGLKAFYSTAHHQ